MPPNVLRNPISRAAGRPRGGKIDVVNAGHQQNHDGKRDENVDVFFIGRLMIDSPVYFLIEMNVRYFLNKRLEFEVEVKSFNDGIGFLLKIVYDQGYLRFIVAHEQRLSKEVVFGIAH